MIQRRVIQGHQRYEKRGNCEDDVIAGARSFLIKHPGQKHRIHGERKRNAGSHSSKRRCVLQKQQIRRNGRYELKSTVRIVAGSHSESAEETRFEFREYSGERLGQAGQTDEWFLDIG
jgi:hypothetical protein